MAIPAPALDTVLPDAKWVIEGTVLEVISQDDPGPAPTVKPGFVDTGHPSPRQVVRLSVDRLLAGPSLGNEVTVEKPSGAYLLRDGVKGPYLLSGAAPHPIILGLYGPDTYLIDAVRAALTRRPA